MELRRRGQQGVQKAPIDGASLPCSQLLLLLLLEDHQFIIMFTASVVGALPSLCIVAVGSTLAAGYGGSGALHQLREDTNNTLVAAEAAEMLLLLLGFEQEQIRSSC